MVSPSIEFLDIQISLLNLILTFAELNLGLLLAVSQFGQFLLAILELN